jgi:hypothetical protein
MTYRFWNDLYDRVVKDHNDACAKQERLLNGRKFYELTLEDGDVLTQYKAADEARFAALEKLNRMLPGELMGQQEQHYLASRFIGNWDHLNYRMENFGYTKQGERWVGKTVDFGTSGPLGFMGTPKHLGHGVADRQRPQSLFALPPTASEYDDFARDVAPALIALDSQPYGRQSKTSIRRVDEALRGAQARLWQDPRYASALEFGYRLERLADERIDAIVKRYWVDAPAEFGLTREDLMVTLHKRKSAMIDQIGVSAVERWKSENPDRVRKIDSEMAAAWLELNLPREPS